MGDHLEPEPFNPPDSPTPVPRLEDYLDDPIPDTDTYAYAYRVGMFRAYLSPGFLQIIAFNLGNDEIDHFVDEFAARFATRHLTGLDPGE